MILGIGTDLVELERIRSFGLERLAKRILHETEQAHLPQGAQRQTEWLAGRFAAKEAVAKAAGTGIGNPLGFQDIRIVADERGCPKVHLSSESRAAMGWQSGIKIHLTISHTLHYATATVIIEKQS